MRNDLGYPSALPKASSAMQDVYVPDYYQFPEYERADAYIMDSPFVLLSKLNRHSQTPNREIVQHARPYQQSHSRRRHLCLLP